MKKYILLMLLLMASSAYGAYGGETLILNYDVDCEHPHYAVFELTAPNELTATRAEFPVMLSTLNCTETIENRSLVWICNNIPKGDHTINITLSPYIEPETYNTRFTLYCYKTVEDRQHGVTRSYHKIFPATAIEEDNDTEDIIQNNDTIIIIEDETAGENKIHEWKNKITIPEQPTGYDYGWIIIVLIIMFGTYLFAVLKRKNIIFKE